MIWIILGVLSIGLLIFYARSRSAVWGGFTIGIVLGIIVAIITYFQSSEFYWSIIFKWATICTIIGFGTELLGMFRKKPIIKSVKEEALESIDLQESQLVNHLNTSHLKEHLEVPKILFENGRLNFIRLSERFKHDDAKFGQITNDWFDYMRFINDVIYESEMLDVSNTDEESDRHWKTRDELYIRIQEISKRFKELLGKEYSDPEKLIREMQK